MKGATSSRKVVPVANKFAILEETMEDMDQNQQATVMKKAREVQMRDQNSPILTKKQDIRLPTTKLNHKPARFTPG